VRSGRDPQRRRVTGAVLGRDWARACQQRLGVCRRWRRPLWNAPIRGASAAHSRRSGRRGEHGRIRGLGARWRQHLHQLSAAKPPGDGADPRHQRLLTTHGTRLPASVRLPGGTCGHQGRRAGRLLCGAVIGGGQGLAGGCLVGGSDQHADTLRLQRWLLHATHGHAAAGALIDQGPWPGGLGQGYVWLTTNAWMTPELSA